MTKPSDYQALNPRASYAMGSDLATCRIDFGDQNCDFFKFVCRFGSFQQPFDLSKEGVALSHQGACIREVRNFCHWASCRDPNLLNWDLGRTSPWTPMESTDPLNSGGCDSSRLGSPNGRSCKLPNVTMPSLLEVATCDTEMSAPPAVRRRLRCPRSAVHGRLRYLRSTV